MEVTPILIGVVVVLVVVVLVVVVIGVVVIVDLGHQLVAVLRTLPEVGNSGISTKKK